MSDKTLFTIGFSSGLLDKLSKEKIIDWCKVDPADRASLLAQMVQPSFDEDDSVFALIANEFSSIEMVDSALSTSLHCRSWSGSEAGMWQKLVDNLNTVASRTKLPGLKKWIEKQIPTIEEFRKRAKIHEDEEKVRRF